MDVALTGLIVAETAVDPASPLADAARAFLVAFLAEVGGVPLSQLDGAFARRRANPMLSAAEHDRLAAAADLVRAAANSPD